jgi:transposase InsO family protein
MSRYRFVEAESGRYPVTQLCRVTEVSRTAYYEWQEGQPAPRAQDDAALTATIRAIHAASGGQYGVPRVLAELRAQGHDDVGRKRVARLMKAAGLRGRRPPRWVCTTTPEPTPPAIPDLVHGEFAAPAPDRLWVGDITYIRTWQGWLYLATVIDVFSRRVIGFALADHMRASLVCDALRVAVATRGGNVDGVIFHSDRGSQYGAAEFRALCEAHAVKQSMGKTGVCWDNALAESFFATYKLELIESRAWPTRARARTATVHWIEAVYNRQRRHSAIDMLSPVDYEDRYWNRRAAA